MPACCRDDAVVEVSLVEWTDLLTSIEADSNNLEKRQRFEHMKFEAKKIGAARLV